MTDNDLRLGKIVYILVFYNISFSWLLSLDGFQFIFLLRDSEKDLYFRVWATCVQSASNAFKAPKFTTATYNIFHTYLYFDSSNHLLFNTEWFVHAWYTYRVKDGIN